MRIKTTVTFDFGKLEKKMPDILDHFANVGAKALAEDARRMIKDGKLRSVTKGTMEIAKKGLSPKRPYPRQGTKSQALLHTGSALSSIKAIDNEVHAAGYLRHHLKPYKIVSNSWVKRHIPGAVGTTVPERNPFFTPKGRLRKPVRDKIKDHKKGIYALMGKHLRK